MLLCWLLVVLRSCGQMLFFYKWYFSILNSNSKQDLVFMIDFKVILFVFKTLSYLKLKVKHLSLFLCTSGLEQTLPLFMVSKSSTRLTFILLFLVHSIFLSSIQLISWLIWFFLYFIISAIRILYSLLLSSVCECGALSLLLLFTDLCHFFSIHSHLIPNDYKHIFT